MINGRAPGSLFRRDDGGSNRRLENLGDLEHLARVGEVIGVIDDLLGTILVDDCGESKRSARLCERLTVAAKSAHFERAPKVE